jgi:carbamoyltransferase
LKKTAVIGISYGHHESSVCLITNSFETLYLREEWLSRVKGDYRFPIESLKYLKNLYHDYEILNVSLFEKPLRNWLSIGTKRKLSPLNYLLKIRQFKESDLSFPKKIKNFFNKQIDIYCPHHLSHALTASAFSFSRKKNNFIHLVMDGYGDGLSGGIFYGNNFNITEIETFKPEQSLGLLYSAITEWVGYKPNEDEYKVMALAAFGAPRYKDFIKKNILNIKNDKIFINQNYFNFSDLGKDSLKKSFVDKFGKKRTVLKKLFMDSVACDVVASFQRAIEETVFDYTELIIDKHKHIFGNISKILLSGGLFHNSKLVGFLEKNIYQKNKIIVEVSPSPGDAGSSIGSAIFAALINNFNIDRYFNQLDPFLGPFAPKINSYDLLFKKITSNPTETIKVSKELLQGDHIIAIYDARFEVGPRALGSRSLICDGKSKSALKKLNEIFKKRESYRPIAPIISETLAKKLFSNSELQSDTALYMGKVMEVSSNASFSVLSKKFPFIHHDKTARAQIIKKNKKYTLSPIIIKLIEKGFILGNTSFNVAGDPMVFDIEDVYSNLIRLEIKYLINDEKLYEVIDV